jgi:hypothetical protein
VTEREVNLIWDHPAVAKAAELKAALEASGANEPTALPRAARQAVPG